MLFNAWLSFNSCVSLKAEAIEASRTVIVCVSSLQEERELPRGGKLHRSETAAARNPHGLRHDDADPSYLISCVMIDSSHGSSLPSAFPQERVYTTTHRLIQCIDGWLGFLVCSTIKVT